MTALPIHTVLPELLKALRSGPNAALIAPPGAGKTTAVAPALLAEPWCTDEVLLLSPRRLPARAAAERMAELAGEAVGRTVGYATRMDSRRSSATRITVMTEGIFRNRLLAEPDLSGVSAVLFDEVHERNLDSDFALALALDSQSAFRPDLRLVAMSATLDGARFAALLDAPTIESEGRNHPLSLRYLGRSDSRIEDAVAAAVRQALREAEGDVLAFLPGVAEIERTFERLTLDGIDVHRLHGSLPPAEQRAAIRRGPRRKVVLATNIAETSLTIDGVRVVVDGGLSRRSRYDRAAGMTLLATERVSQAAATQRAGRAARQGAGVAYRLWEEAATGGLPRFDPPEILEADLSSTLLDCAIWGAVDPLQLRWLDPPPPAALEEARARLCLLGALNAEGRATPHGKALARLPLPPRLAHMLVRATDKERAAEVAMLLSERALGGGDVDLQERLGRWRRDHGSRAGAARRTAARWAAMARGDSRGSAGAQSVGELVALAFPDRVARRRSPTGDSWASSGGRGLRLDPASPLARSEWLAVAEVGGVAVGSRILAAAALTAWEVERLLAERVQAERTLIFDPAKGELLATRRRSLGAIILSDEPDDALDRTAAAGALLEAVRAHGLGLVPFPDAARALRLRAAFARGHGFDGDLTDEALLARLDEWLAPLLPGRRRLPEIPPAVLESLLSWPQWQALDRLAPPDFISPAGTRHRIDYGAEGGPRVDLRVQALFGLDRHPTAGGRPLVLSLTSPAGRPIQTTRDLPQFWRGSWAEVAKDMRGRYPRHNWPERPWEATASLKTKKALGKG